MGTPLNFPEYDPAVLRRFPFLSRRRRNVVNAVRAAMAADIQTTTASIARLDTLLMAAETTIRNYSSRTLELMLDHFADRSGIVLCLASYVGSADEMLARAAFSYHDVLVRPLPRIKPTAESTRKLSITFNAAKRTDNEFLNCPDLSVLQGETRLKFEAVLLVLAYNHPEQRWEEFPSLSPKMAELVLARPDRVMDIVDYQQDRKLSLRDIDAAQVEEYINSPVMSLSNGVL